MGIRDRSHEYLQYWPLIPIFGQAYSRLPVPFGGSNGDAHRLRTRDAATVCLRACVFKEFAKASHNSFMQGIRKKNAMQADRAKLVSYAQ